MTFLQDYANVGRMKEKWPCQGKVSAARAAPLVTMTILLQPLGVLVSLTKGAWVRWGHRLQCHKQPNRCHRGGRLRHQGLLLFESGRVYHFEGSRVERFGHTTAK